MALMRAILLSCLCFTPLHGKRQDDLGLDRLQTEEQLAVVDSNFAEESIQQATQDDDPPQCPVEIPKEHGGDPAKKWCCASGAKMFDRRSFTVQMNNEPSTIWMNNGCKVCAEAEARFEVFNVEVKKFPRRAGKASTVTVTTYADLDPKIDPDNLRQNGPLYLEDGTFNPGHQYVLYLYTKADHNGAFRFANKLCDRLNCWASRGYEVVMRRIESINEAEAVLDKFPDDALHHVVLSGHGNARSLMWGYGSGGSLTKGAGSTHDFLMKLRTKITIDGSVLLDACLNAQDRAFDLQNLFEYVASKLPGRKITASKISLSDDMWESVQKGEDPREFVEDADEDFDETCQAGDKVKFVKDGVDQTAIRKQGRPNCKELKLDEIGRFDSCLTRCGDQCSDVWKKDWNNDDRKNAPYTLRTDKAAAEQIVKKDMNPCWWGRKKMVCKLESA